MSDHEPTSLDPADIIAAPDPILAAIRDLVLKAYPNVVPEMVTGESVDDLLASVGPASDAYTRLADSLQPAPPTVPAGASTPAALDPERMPATLKIQLGLRNRAAS